LEIGFSRIYVLGLNFIKFFQFQKQEILFEQTLSLLRSKYIKSIYVIKSSEILRQAFEDIFQDKFFDLIGKLEAVAFQRI
jgi:hypothetical protein